MAVGKKPSKFSHKSNSGLSQHNRPFKNKTKGINPSGRHAQISSEVRPTVKLVRKLRAEQRISTQRVAAATHKAKRCAAPPILITFVIFHRTVDIEGTRAALCESLLKVGATLENQHDDGKARANFPIFRLPAWGGKTLVQLNFCEYGASYSGDIEALTSHERQELMFAVLDACKAADVVVAVFGRATAELPAFDALGYELQVQLMLQGTPAMVGLAGCVINADAAHKPHKGTKLKTGGTALIERYFHSEFGKDKKFFSLTSDEYAVLPESSLASVINKMFRHVVQSCVGAGFGWRADRGYLLAEEVEYDAARRVLALSGFARGEGFTCSVPVHLTGFGDGCLLEIRDRQHGGLCESLAGNSSALESARSGWVSLQPFGSRLSPSRPEEREVDDEMAMAVVNPSDGMDDTGVSEDEDNDQLYKASGPEEIAQEKQRLANLRERSEDEMEFADEVDTPLDIPAKERFSAYRGLKSFEKSFWDPYKELPEEYGRLFCFESFWATMNESITSFKNAIAGSELLKNAKGKQISLYISGLEEEAAEKCVSLHTKGWPIVCSTLFAHERKLSVQHFSLLRRPEIGSYPIKGTMNTTIQCGFRRGLVRPVYSFSKNGDFTIDLNSPRMASLNKQKYLKTYDDSLGSKRVVMSFIGPCMAKKMPTLVWTGVDVKDQPDQDEWKPNFVLSAMGNYLRGDPLRLIIKRILLTGYPIKTGKRKCVIRWLFHYRQDVEWFKPLELTTKRGISGRIMEPVGTHGHMKCIFSGGLSYSDTVCLPLYKRWLPMLADGWQPNGGTDIDIASLVTST